ncbi:hypothetical protein [Saccharopolyspora gregorii]|uniref:Lipoprotein n=1 Tax=Saccharopolyspora gregorii TaxID=33914 RepID=A0ABP6RWW9_9PSEU
MRTTIRAAAAAAVLAVSAGCAGCGSPALRVEGPALAPPQPATTAEVAPPTGAELRNIRNIDLRSTVLADPKVPDEVKRILRGCSVCGLEDPVYADVTKDGEADVLAPVHDSGSGGTKATLVYSVRDQQVSLVFGYLGPDAGLRAEGGDLVLDRDLYAPDDAHCCPTATERLRFSWDGHRFAMAERTGGAPGTTPYGGWGTIIR